MANVDGLQPPKSEPWMDTLVHKLRVESPPNGNAGWQRYEKFAVAILSAALAFMGVAYWRAADSSAEFEKMAREARDGVKQIQTERAARIAAIDTKFDAIENELRTYRIAYAEFQQMKGTVTGLGQRLDDGKKERLTDRDAMMDRINRIDVGWQLLQQRVEGRRQDSAPFGRDQSWPYLQRDPYGLRARMGQELSPIVRRMALAEVR